MQAYWGLSEKTGLTESPRRPRGPVYPGGCCCRSAQGHSESRWGSGCTEAALPAGGAPPGSTASAGSAPAKPPPPLRQGKRQLLRECTDLRSFRITEAFLSGIIRWPRAPHSIAVTRWASLLWQGLKHPWEAPGMGLHFQEPQPGRPLRAPESV